VPVTQEVSGSNPFHIASKIKAPVLIVNLKTGKVQVDEKTPEPLFALLSKNINRISAPLIGIKKLDHSKIFPF
tara:strand:+ start:1575 stop:1793 length:219 start_codon:yes stop_codon:yes gene_type:complete